MLHFSQQADPFQVLQEWVIQYKTLIQVLIKLEKYKAFFCVI
jgi:hypothetical protein